MSKDYYNILWINKNSTEAEIKKAYRKKAMEWHPDKHKWDKKAEEKFKEINEAYQILWDSKKKKQYDTFGSNSWNYNFDWFSSWWFWGFEDLFKNQTKWWNYNYSQNFDIWDIFGDLFWQNKKKKNPKSNPFDDFSNYQEPQQKPKIEENLDVEKIYEIPIFDLILWTKLDIQTVYNENLKLKIPECTKPWTKFKIKWKWRTNWGKTWDLYIISEAKMPKNIPENVKKLLESIKFSII